MKNLEPLVLATTDIGSLPIHDDFEAGRVNFERAALDKVAVGLDYPCYPQLPGTRESPMSMTLQFLLPLERENCGVTAKGADIYRTGEITRPSCPVGIERPLFFRELLERRGLLDRVKGVKACVTGPFTLAGFIDRENILTCGASKPKVVSALAEVVADACETLVDAGFSLISVDEPFFTVMLGRRVLFSYGEEYIVETLNSVFERIRCFSSIHVCGAVSPTTKKVLLRCDVDVLDHEFEATPNNYGVYSREELEGSGKMLALGCVSSTDPRIESVDHIRKSIERGFATFGERLLIKPDCGFGGLMGVPSAYEIAIQKLKNMVEAVKQTRAELS